VGPHPSQPFCHRTHRQNFVPQGRPMPDQLAPLHACGGQPSVGRAHRLPGGSSSRLWAALARETLLVDLLNPVMMTAIDVRMPSEEQARQVAEAAHRGADGWKNTRGVGSPCRSQRSETGSHLRRRHRIALRPLAALLRLRASMIALAAGGPGGNAARNVGYESASAFVCGVQQGTGLIRPRTSAACHAIRRSSGYAARNEAVPARLRERAMRMPLACLTTCEQQSPSRTLA